MGIEDQAFFYFFSFLSLKAPVLGGDFRGWSGWGTEDDTEIE